ncbi:MAG TPA: glucuronate isomerase [Spirochaetota bacterium]|nr:glucuronate isomerase [Spirochaetota bacterium]
MKKFMDKNFLLTSKPARKLYHNYAAPMPICDYHCHLTPADIASDKIFSNLTEVWLKGDHYKWRAMRANGVAEKYCTGDASAEDKFKKWAATVPATVKNPLYHWTHMELRRYFGINKLLNPETAAAIYEQASAMLNSRDFSARNLLRKMNVKFLCTTDDPIDDLGYHKQIREEGCDIKVLPTWRPDKLLAVDDSAVYNSYIDKLQAAAGIDIKDYNTLQQAVRKRHDYFEKAGCVISDHGIELPYAAECTAGEAAAAFDAVRSGKELAEKEKLKLRSALMLFFGELNHAKGWVQQIHMGPIRNNNTKMFRRLGPDSGYDSIGDFNLARPLARFLDKLELREALAKTVLYNINPGDNAVLATMIGNFQDGSVPGRMQFGSGWWFLDQKRGIEDQLENLSAQGLLSRFIGMLTDSRSLLSFPRHEYFRRILCNVLGRDMANGEIPADYELVGKMVRNICYYNVVSYLGLKEQ